MTTQATKANITGNACGVLAYRLCTLVVVTICPGMISPARDHSEATFGITGFVGQKPSIWETFSKGTALGKGWVPLAGSWEILSDLLCVLVRP